MYSPTAESLIEFLYNKEASIKRNRKCAKHHFYDPPPQWRSYMFHNTIGAGWACFPAFLMAFVFPVIQVCDFAQRNDVNRK